MMMIRKKALFRRFALRDDDGPDGPNGEDDGGATSILGRSSSNANAHAAAAEVEAPPSDISNIATASKKSKSAASKKKSHNNFTRKKKTKRGPITTTEQSLYNMTAAKVPILGFEDKSLLSPTIGTKNHVEDRSRRRWDTIDVIDLSATDPSSVVSKTDKDPTKPTTTTTRRIPPKKDVFDPFNVEEFEGENVGKEFGKINQENSLNDMDETDNTLQRSNLGTNDHDENYKDEWQPFSPNDNDLQSNPFETISTTFENADRFHREVLEQQRKISSRRILSGENKDKKKSIGDTTIHSQIMSLSSEDETEDEEQNDENMNPFFHHDFDNNTKNENLQVSRTEAFLRRIERQRESLVSADSNDEHNNNNNNMMKIADTVQNFVRRHSTLSYESTDRNDTKNRESILSFPEREPAIEFLKKQEEEEDDLQNNNIDVVAETNHKLMPSSSQESGDIFLNLVANPTMDSNTSENVADARQNLVCPSTTNTFASIETKLLSNAADNPKTKMDTEIGGDQDDEIEVSNHVKITASSSTDLDSDYGIEVAVDAVEDAAVEEPQNPDIVEIMSSTSHTDISRPQQEFEDTRSESNSGERSYTHSTSLYDEKTKPNSDNPMTNLLEAAAPIIGNESIRSIRRVAERFGMALDDATHADMNEPAEEIFHVYSTDTSVSSKSSAFSSSNGRSRSFLKHRSSSDVKDLESFGSLLDTDSNDHEDISECHTVMSSLPGEEGPTVTRLSIDMRAIDPASVSGRAGLYHVQQPSACSSKTGEQTESSDERSHQNSYQYQDFLELEVESLSTLDNSEKSKPRQHTERSKKKSRPLGASFDEIENINKFLSIAGPDFDGSNLSIEEREILHDKALKAGMPEAFINRILDQSAGIITWESYSWLPSIDEDDDDDDDDDYEYDHIPPTNPVKSRNKQSRHRNLSPGRSNHTKNSSGDQTKETISTSYSDSTHEDDSRYHRKESQMKKTSSSGVIGFIKTMFLDPPADIDELYYNVSRSFDSSSRQSYHRHHRHKRERERDHHRHQHDRDRRHQRQQHHQAAIPSPPREMPEHKRFLT